MNILALAWVAFAVVWAIGFGSRAAWLARERRRDPRRWFLFGAVLGPAGLLILDDAPPGTCASCLAPVAGWSMTCVACGEDVRTNARVAKLLGTQARTEPARAQEEPHLVTGVAVGPGRPVTAPTAVPAAAEPSTASAGSPVRRRRATTSPVRSTAARPAEAPQARPSAETPARSSSRTLPSAHRPEQVARDAAPIPIRPSRAPVAPQAAASPTAAPSDAPPQLDLLRRPVRLASCVFVEGNVKLLPGLWYQLTSEGDTLTITGQAGSIPNASAFSRSLSDVQVRTRGDELVVTAASDSGEELRLVFNSTLDWTPLGVTNEVEARRRALRAG